MKISVFTAIVGLVGCAIPALAALTKGYIQLRGPDLEAPVNLSTLIDTFDGDIMGSNTEPLLQVQMDLNRAQETDSDIEILNGFWVPDLYRYLGINAQGRFALAWDPPNYPYTGYINVQQTPDAQLQQKENAFTASYPNMIPELPFQASAIWRYHPSQGGKLTSTLMALNGTPLPVVTYGGWYDGKFWFSAAAPSGSRQPIDFYFVSESE